LDGGDVMMLRNAQESASDVGAGQGVGARLPRIRPVTVEFGAPLALAGHGSAESGRARRKATDEIMAAIQRMSGQEFADAYNEPPAVSFAERVRRAFGRNRKH